MEVRSPLFSVWTHLHSSWMPSAASFISFYCSIPLFLVRQIPIKMFSFFKIFDNSYAFIFPDKLWKDFVPFQDTWVWGWCCLQYGFAWEGPLLLPSITAPCGSAGKPRFISPQWKRGQKCSPRPSGGTCWELRTGIFSPSCIQQGREVPWTRKGELRRSAPLGSFSDAENYLDFCLV